MIGPDDDTPPMGIQVPDRCWVTCDKGSRCARPKHEDDRHETEHGCICYGIDDTNHQGGDLDAAD